MALPLPTVLRRNPAQAHFVEIAMERFRGDGYPDVSHSWLVDPAKRGFMGLSGHEHQPGLMLIDGPQGSVPVFVHLITERVPQVVQYEAILYLVGPDKDPSHEIRRQSNDRNEVMAAIAKDLKGIEREGAAYFHKHGGRAGY